MAAWAGPALAADAVWGLRVAVWACLVSSAMLVAEAAYMGVASLLAALAPQRLRPRRRHRWEPMPGCEGGDVEAAAEFPMVLVQIPMYNEREVRLSVLEIMKSVLLLLGQKVIRTQLRTPLMVHLRLRVVIASINQ
jgi:hypothetical protein